MVAQIQLKQSEVNDLNSKNSVSQLVLHKAEAMESIPLKGQDWKLVTETAKLTPQGDLAIQSSSVDGIATFDPSQSEIDDPNTTYQFKGHVALKDQNGQIIDPSDPLYKTYTDRVQVIVQFVDSSGKQVEKKYLQVKINPDGSLAGDFKVPPGCHVGSIALENYRDYGSNSDTAIFSNLEISHDGSSGTDIPGAIDALLNDPLLKTIFAGNPSLQDLQNIALKEFPQAHQDYDHATDYQSKEKAYQREQSLLAQFKGDVAALPNSLLQQLKNLSGPQEAELQKVLSEHHCLASDLPAIVQGLASKLSPSAPELDPAPTPPTPPSADGSFMSDDAEAAALLQDPETRQLFESLKSGTSSDPKLQALLSQLQTDKTAYQNAKSTAEKAPLAQKIRSDLSSVHGYILDQLVAAVQSAAKDPSRTIGRINGDFTDPNDLRTHLAELQSLACLSDGVSLDRLLPPALQGPQNQVQDSTFNTLPSSGAASPWTTSGGVTVHQNGGPFGYDNSVVIPGGGSVQQSFQGKPNTQYVVAAYVKSSSSNGIGKIDVTGTEDPDAGHYEDWTSGTGPKGTTPQWHLVYFRVRSDQSGKINLNFHTDSGAGNSMEVANAQVLAYGGSESMAAMNKSVQGLYPFPHVSGPVQKGAYPQHKTAWTSKDSFVPGFDATNGMPHQGWWDFNQATVVNGQNGQRWADIKPTGEITATASSKTQTLLPTTASDSYHFHAVLRNPGGAIPPSPSITVTAVDNSVTPQQKYTYQVPIPASQLAAWKAGKEITIDQDFSAANFPGLPPGHHVQFLVNVSGYKGSGEFQASDVGITAKSQSTVDKVNSNWFYNQNDPFANPSSGYDGYTESTDFTKAETGRWDKLIAGNEDLNPDANFKPVEGEGLPLQGNYNSDGTFKTQGVAFPHPVGACGRGWELDTTFTVRPPNPAHKPVIALWAYGNAEPSGNSPLDHLNGGADSMVNEVDMEIGDPDASHTSQVVYSGKTSGGKSHETHYPKLPFNVYDGGVYKASITATRVINPETGKCEVQEVRDPKTGDVKEVPLMKFQWSLTQVEDASGNKTNLTEPVGSPIIKPFNGVVNAVVSTEQMKSTDKTAGDTTVILKNNTVKALGPALSPKEYPGLAQPSDTDYGEGTPSTGFQGCPFDDQDTGLQAQNFAPMLG